MNVKAIVFSLLFSVSAAFGGCNPVVCVFAQSVKMRLQNAVALDLAKIKQTCEHNPIVGVAMIFDHFVIDPKHFLQVDLDWLMNKVVLNKFDAEGLDEQIVIKLQQFAEHVVLQDSLGRWIIPMVDNPSFIRARSIVVQYDAQTIHNVSLDNLVQQFLVGLSV